MQFSKVISSSSAQTDYIRLGNHYISSVVE